LVEFYPNFQTKLRASLRALVGPEVESRVDIGMAKDGSGVGGKFNQISSLVSILNMSQPPSVRLLLRDRIRPTTQTAHMGTTLKTSRLRSPQKLRTFPPYRSGKHRYAIRRQTIGCIVLGSIHLCIESSRLLFLLDACLFSSL
jgi:hypothetical protein